MEASGSSVFAPGLLEGRVCVISGAGTGLGRATALELASLGAIVVGCGRREEPLTEMVAEVAESGGSAEARSLDIRDEAGVEAFFEDLVERHGHVDALVNNAGGQFLSPAEAITAKGFRTVIELNVMGTWLMTHAAATKAFIPQRRGAILNVTLSPHNGMPGMVHSGAARAAVENMTRTLAIEWARFGIRTAAVAAGQFETEVFKTKYPKEVTEAAAQTIPAGRLGWPEEMAWLLAYLCSPAAEFISGTTLTIDGARDDHFGPWPPTMFGSRDGEPVAEERRPKR